MIVAENGAVLEFPSTVRRVVLGHPPPPAVIQALGDRGLDFAVGESVIEADAAAAPSVLEIIRRLEQPLVLAFNRGRLMVLPQAVAKSTALRHALFELRLSSHNVVGIGDAENDHDLLDACEVGVAVSWGSSALRSAADEIIEGQGPRDVADYIRRLCRQPRLSAAQMGRRRLALGYEHTGEPVNLAIRGRTVVIAGEPGSGKSWLGGLLCEQLILQGYHHASSNVRYARAAVRGATVKGNRRARSGARKLRATARFRHPWSSRGGLFRGGGKTSAVQTRSE